MTNVMRHRSAHSGPCPVLVVEDDRDLREMMLQLLAAEGFEPIPARDGIEALECLRSSREAPHVILLDMMMPRMDGWTFRAVQERDPHLAPIPVVVLSAAPRDQLASVHAAAILQKPLDYEQLIEAVSANC
jgi:CheY-like chemotaxis protein